MPFLILILLINTFANFKNRERPMKKIYNTMITHLLRIIVAYHKLVLSASIYIAGREPLKIHLERYCYICVANINKLVYAAIDFGQGWVPLTDNKGSRLAFKSEVELFKKLASLGWRYRNKFTDAGLVCLFFEKKD